MYLSQIINRLLYGKLLPSGNQLHGLLENPHIVWWFSQLQTSIQFGDFSAMFEDSVRQYPIMIHYVYIYLYMYTCIHISVVWILNATQTPRINGSPRCLTNASEKIVCVVCQSQTSNYTYSVSKGFPCPQRLHCSIATEIIIPEGLIFCTAWLNLHGS